MRGLVRRLRDERGEGEGARVEETWAQSRAVGLSAQWQPPQPQLAWDTVRFLGARTVWEELRELGATREVERRLAGDRALDA